MAVSTPRCNGLRSSGAALRGGCLAASSLVLALLSGGAVPAAEPTRETGIGVWYQPGAPRERVLWERGDPGERLNLELRLLSREGRPVAGAEVELWQADGAGVVHADRYRTTLISGDDGVVRVVTALPGYVWRARHIHYVVTHRDHTRLVTRLFFKGDPALTEYPEPGLTVALEEARLGGETSLFATFEVVLDAVR